MLAALNCNGAKGLGADHVSLLHQKKLYIIARPICPYVQQSKSYTAARAETRSLYQPLRKLAETQLCQLIRQDVSDIQMASMAPSTDAEQ